MNMKLISSLLNLFWVMRAFRRGMGLRQKAYRPDENGVFYAMPGATYKRMAMLIRWWGYRPGDLEDFIDFMGNCSDRSENLETAHVVALGSNDNYDDIAADPGCRFLTKNRSNSRSPAIGVDVKMSPPQK